MPDKQENGSVPTNIAMMIGEINGTIKSEFASLNKELSSLRADLTKVRDDHEHRISDLEGQMAGRQPLVDQHRTLMGKVESLESWRSEVQGGAKGIGLGWKVGTALIGALAGIGAMLGVQSYSPHKQVAKSELTVERSYSAPVFTNGH